MVVCDWCGKGGIIYNIFVQQSPKYADGKEKQLCRKCVDKLEKYEAEAIFEATQRAKKERIEEIIQEV